MAEREIGLHINTGLKPYDPSSCTNCHHQQTNHSYGVGFCNVTNCGCNSYQLCLPPFSDTEDGTRCDNSLCVHLQSDHYRGIGGCNHCMCDMFRFVSTSTEPPEASPEPKESVCQEAHRIINGQRRTDYGGPKESFERIAALWSPVLGVEVKPEQVAICMIQLKVARAVNGWQRDSLTDICGYAGCAAKVLDLDD